jgi:hypothetical protein
MTMETVAAGEPRTTGHPCGRSLRARRRNGRTSVALADWNEKVVRSAAMELVAQGHKALAIHRAAQALYDVGRRPTCPGAYRVLAARTNLTRRCLFYTRLVATAVSAGSFVTNP